MRVESEEEGGMKVGKERELIEEEDTIVVAEGRGERGTTEVSEERGEEGMTAVVKGREERDLQVIAVTEGRGEMEPPHLMMAARTLQRLLVGEAEGGSHTRKRRRELVNLEEEEEMMTQLHPLRNDNFQMPRDIHTECV